MNNMKYRTVTYGNVTGCEVMLLMKEKVHSLMKMVWSVGHTSRAAVSIMGQIHACDLKKQLISNVSPVEP